MTSSFTNGGGYGAGFSGKGVAVTWPIGVERTDGSAVRAADCGGATGETEYVFAVGPDGTDAANAVDAFE